MWGPPAARAFQAFKAEMAAAPEALRRIADWPEPCSALEATPHHRSLNPNL